MGKDVIIALDFDGEQKTLDFLNHFKGYSPYVKIGMELFYSSGPSLVYNVKELGYRVFLDLKLHDIPNTVKKAMSVLKGLSVDMCNLHAAGGSVMMKAALEGLCGDDGKRPILIAVTQLTSTSEELMHKELLIGESMEKTVMSYAKNAALCGLDGVVCSPLEAAAVKDACESEFLTVTPGIRFSDDEKGDQVRVTTPERAKHLRSDYIVVGRSITAAKDPLEAYLRCVNEFVD